MALTITYTSLSHTCSEERERGSLALFQAISSCDEGFACDLEATSRRNWKSKGLVFRGAVFQSMLPELEEFEERMDAIVCEVEEPKRTPELYEKDFTEVMGPDGHGRVRLLGAGPSPGQVHGVSSSRGSLRVNYAEAIDELRTIIRAELETDWQSRMDAALKRQELDMLACEAAREAERQTVEDAREAAYEAKMKRLESMYARLEAVPAALSSHQKQPPSLTKKRMPNPARTTAKNTAKTSGPRVCPSTMTKAPYIDKVGGLKNVTVLSTDTPAVEVATGTLSDYTATLNGKGSPPTMWYCESKL